MPKFDDRTPSPEPDAVTASARLPGLDIEIVHRSSPDKRAEQISITLTAAPSFEAFGGYLEAVNPLAIWVQAVQLAWLPWVEAMRSVTPTLRVPSLPDRRRSGRTDYDQQQD